ncbi:hypothetical protein A2397_05310 [Candidatus Amesbacteria bacterium RIFOXYB1_FULL_44_23]|uniref:Uncharacterized protein n=1 Tax=Candidatus Amesbacteria bacterium RIFOXYB1_FULL_44_23 TaxID=1797263 RepID=A0A1F4ZU01_9BACT|nr:MAG: hypothetical protein A2397_05310 [Candidatus Amesbacteria bacterium RIFOXYB1_FULL_44_23]
MNSKQTVPLRAAVYLRVSTDDQIEKYGIPLQKAAVDAVINSKGKLDDGSPAMVLAGEQYIYKDEGVSGADPLDERPAFLRMKEDIENAPEGEKPFDIVAVYRIDRFARKLKILLEVIEYYEAHDIQFISANESIDTSTPFGKAMLGIIGVIAELERETTKARTQAGKVQAIERGVYMGAQAPYGYLKDKDKHLQVFAPESKVVEEIFELFVSQKKNTQQIADYLASKKILTPLPSAVHYGKRRKGRTKVNDEYFWRDSTVRGIVKDEIYLGIYYYNKHEGKKRLDKSLWKKSPTEHDSIIDYGTFSMAQQRIKEDVALRNSAKAVENHLYLLSGLLKCHACYDPYSGRDPLNWSGTSKVIKKNGKRAYYYHCGAKNSKKYSTVCKAIPFPADEIEAFVTQFIKDLLSDPENVYRHINTLQSTKMDKRKLLKRQVDITKMLNRIPGSRQNIKRMYGKGDITDADYDERMANVKKQEADLRKDLLVIQGQIGEDKISEIYASTFKLFAKKYKPFLDGLMTDRQEVSDLIHLIVDRVNVYTRKATKKDKIAGRKKEDQVIPYQVRIDLRLPQDIMQRLARQGKFEVRNDNL